MKSSLSAAAFLFSTGCTGLSPLTPPDPVLDEEETSILESLAVVLASTANVCQVTGENGEVRVALDESFASASSLDAGTMQGFFQGLAFGREPFELILTEGSSPNTGYPCASEGGSYGARVSFSTPNTSPEAIRAELAFDCLTPDAESTTLNGAFDSATEFLNLSEDKLGSETHVVALDTEATNAPEWGGEGFWAFQETVVDGRTFESEGSTDPSCVSAAINLLGERGEVLSVLSDVLAGGPGASFSQTTYVYDGSQLLIQ